MINYKRKRFCRLWLRDFNATRAAIDAGYSPTTAHVTGCRILQDPDVIKFIEKLQRSDDDKLDITREDVLREFARVGMQDIRSLFTENGSLKPIHELDDHAAAAVASVEVVSSTLGQGEATVVEHTHKIKLHPKIQALDKLGQHFNIYEDHQKSGQDNVVINIEGKDAQA